MPDPIVKHPGHVLLLHSTLPTAPPGYYMLLSIGPEYCRLCQVSKKETGELHAELAQTMDITPAELDQFELTELSINWQ